MEFIYNLFPEEGIQVKQLVLDAGLWAVAAVIWFILALWLAKRVHSRLCKGLSKHFRGKRASENKVIKALTAEPLDTKREDGFIIITDEFAGCKFDAFENHERDNYPADTGHQTFATSCDMSDIDYLGRVGGEIQ